MPDGHIGLLFPQGVKGLTIEEGSWNPMGMRGSYSPTLLLDNCMIGDENVLGTPGFMPRDRWQARFHLSFAAQYLGGAQGVFDYLAEYIPRRGTAGDGYAQLRMGEIRIGIESARWLIYRAAALWQRKDIAEAEMFSMLAKHRAIENAVITMDKAAQIAGSSAFMADSAARAQVPRPAHPDAAREHRQIRGDARQVSSRPELRRHRPPVTRG